MITLGLGKIVLNRPEPSAAVLRALSDTVAWCLSRSLQRDQLRSHELDSSAFLRVPPFNELLAVWLEKKRDSYQQATHAINEKRSALVRDAKIEMADFALAQSKGRLLLYFPLESVEDGAAASSSQGFFDIVGDAPPWDTWFAYSGESIFCWVPESLVQNAQAGIDANPVDCIQWCDWSKLSELQDM